METFKCQTAIYECETKEHLIEAWACCLRFEQLASGRTDIIAMDVAVMTAEMHLKYVPHIYRGGWVIPGFGYSVERIGKHVQPQFAGNPLLVK